MDAKPKLASYHQIFLAPSEEEKGSLPTPDDGNLWHVLSVAYREGKYLSQAVVSEQFVQVPFISSFVYRHCRHTTEKGKLC